MSDTTTEPQVVLGKRYNFPQLSTRDVTVLQTIECWIEFYEQELVWLCEYRALWKDEEDPDTKVTRDIEKTHCWKYTVDRSSIASVEFVYSNDAELWMVKVYTTGIDNIIQLAFSTRVKCERMYRYFCQYKGFEHY